jgi:hypothetical protein
MYFKYDFLYMVALYWVSAKFVDLVIQLALTMKSDRFEKNSIL